VTSRPRWDFPYAPVPAAANDDDGGPVDVIIAMREPTETHLIARAIARISESSIVQPLVVRAPIFWWRVRSTQPATRRAVEDVLREDGLPLRYVASATRASTRLGPPLDFRGVALARADAWRRRKAPAVIDDAPSSGRWFLREAEGGIAIDRVLGTGAGTRLAVIDDDGAEAQHLALDAEIPVGIERVPRATSHGALMVAWACAARGPRPFHGVAPGASPRLYVIEKPGLDVVSLPMGIAQATFDGADVVVCATYVEGSTSPMLDDALTVAHRLGRRGLGTAVVLPTGREASSPDGSLHSSWTLALGDPASDPRVFCVGPSARGADGWFLWRDRRGRLRPFANRGPHLRWLAPGDDVAYPFGERDRLFHAESSGASAIAAGALLTVLGVNPSLRLRELDAIVTRTCTPLPADASDPQRTPLADPADLLPHAGDADGHNAKHGYGRIHARRAMLAATDPFASALLAIGEVEAAHACATQTKPWSPRLSRWAVRALLRDASLAHDAKALVRHARLVAGRPERARAHGEGTFLRQLSLFLRKLSAAHPPPSLRAELDRLAGQLHDEPSEVERACHAAIDHLWLRPQPNAVRAGGEPPLGTGGVHL
jgi:hypothetical protein